MQIGSSHITSTFLPQRPESSEDSERYDQGLARQEEGHAAKPATSVSLSEAAKQALGKVVGPGAETSGAEAGAEASKAESPNAPDKPKRPGELTQEEEKQVAELKARDAEVRAHEQAHVAASGGLTNGPIHYEYQRGPDNQQYAIGGHVSIDTSPVPGDPEKTIQKAQTIRRSALAPAEPSGADKRIAAKASSMEQEARTELAVQAQEEQALEKEEAEAKRAEKEAADGESGGASEAGPRPTVHASRAVASYAMAA